MSYVSYVMEYLMPEELKKELPPFHTQREKEDPIAKVYYFECWSKRAWAGIEYDGRDTLWGAVRDEDGITRLDTFRLSDLARIRGPWKLEVTREHYFKVRPLSQLEIEIGLIKSELVYGY